MKYKEFRKELCKELNISEATLYNRAEKIADILQIDKKDAIKVYALENCKRIAKKYIKDKGEILSIREHIKEYRSKNNNAPIIERPIKTIQKEKKLVAIKKPKKVEVKDPILDPKKIEEANEMGELYPYLYILENSIREFIDRVLTKKHGDEWWKLEELESIKNNIEKNKDPEKKHTWHQKKGDRAIDYLDMDDLPKIVRKMFKDFKPNELPDHEWFYALIKEVYISRCVLAHMNPLNETSVRSLKVKYDQWQEHLEKIKKHLIQ